MNLEALPIEVKQSAMTDSQKKVLNVFFTYNTLDKTTENGLFFISNEQLRKEAEIGSNKTIQSVLSFLINNNFIQRTAGKQCPNGGVASTYALNSDNIIEWCKSNKKMGTPKMGTPNEKCTDVCTDVCTDRCTDVCTDVLMTELKAIRQENKELKQMLEYVISTLKMGTPNEKCTDRCTTDTDIEIDNKLINTLVNTPVKEEIEIRNADNNNFNIEVVNNEIKKEEMNNEIPTLEDVLRQQAEEQNNLLKEAYNDNFNFEGNFEIPVKGSNNFNSEEQKRYSNIFAKTKALIDEWYTTHDTITKAQIETNIKVIGWMYERGDISVKQFNTAQEKLTNHFKKLLNGHLDYVINKKYSSTFKNKNPQPPRPEENGNKAILSHENSRDMQTTIQDDKTQQDANKVAKMKSYSKEEKKHFEELIDNGSSEADLKNIVEYIKCVYNGYPALKMERLKNFCSNTDFNGCTGIEVYNELKQYIAENIA